MVAGRRKCGQNVKEVVLSFLFFGRPAGAGCGNDFEGGGSAVDVSQRIGHETLEDSGVPLADFVDNQLVLLNSDVRAVAAQRAAVKDPVVLRGRSAASHAVETDAGTFLDPRILR